MLVKFPYLLDTQTRENGNKKKKKENKSKSQQELTVFISQVLVILMAFLQ